MTTLRYQPVEPETLEIHPEDVYRRDHDTENIFGDPAGRMTVGMRELLMVHHRFEFKQKIVFFGSLLIMFSFALVVLLLIKSGYTHVIEDIQANRIRAKTGIQITPTLDVRNVIFLYEDEQSNYSQQYTDEIDKLLQEYEKEQISRNKFVQDCNSTDKPEGKWCNFTLTSIPGSEACTKENNYGYKSKSPCFVVQFKDRINWVPEFEDNSTHTHIPFKCENTFKMLQADTPLNISYIPSLGDDGEYGAFPLNKIPARILTQNGREIVDDDANTLYDLPPLAFVKLNLPSNFLHGVIKCYLVDNHPEARIKNLESLSGIREITFSLTAHNRVTNLLFLSDD